MSRKGERKTACKHGHDLTDPANVRINTRGAQVCLPCQREASRRRRGTEPAARMPQVSTVEAEAFLAQLQSETEASLRRDPSRWRLPTSHGGRAWRDGTLGR